MSLRSPLHSAAARGDSRQVKQLLDSGKYNVDCKNKKARTPLHEACFFGHLDTARILLKECGADANVRDWQDNTPMHRAALGGRTEMVEMLVNEFKCCIDVRGFHDRTVLHQACQGGNVELVQILIRNYKMSVSSLDKDGNYPIHVAARGGHSQIVDELVQEFNCRIDERGYLNRTILHYACGGGHLELVRKLIRQYKMNVADTDKDGDYPLHLAALAGQSEVVDTLVQEFNCSTDVRGYMNRTVLHRACYGGNEELVEKLIREYKMSVMDVDKQGNYPVHVAAIAGQLQIVDLLLREFNCHIDLQGFEGRTLLHMACIKGNEQLTEKMIRDYNMNVADIDNNGNTPLHYASMCGHKNIVEFLLYAHNSPVLARNRDGQIAKEIAYTDEIEEVLSSYAKQRSEQLSNIKISRGSITRVLVVGHPGAGKSSLVEALKKDGLISRSVFGRRVSERNVPPRTAGIVPSTVQKDSGRILFFDFAGDPEYYSSHAAIVEAISGPGANLVFLVVDLCKDREVLIGEISFWLTFISENSKHPKCFCDIVITGSHADILRAHKTPTQPILDDLERESRAICTSLVEGHLCIKTTFEADCCSPSSTSIIRKHLNEKLSQTAPQELSYHACIMLGLLERDFRPVIACKMATLLHHIKECSARLPEDASRLLDIALELHHIGVLLIIQSTNGNPLNYWLVFKVSVLTQEVHQTLFSVDSHKNLRISSRVDEEYRSLIKLGILPESELQRLLPTFIPMECLYQLQYCQEIPTVDILPDHSVQEREHDSTSLLFFPALIELKREDVKLLNSTSATCCRGCRIMCTTKHATFSQRFVHILLLRMAFSFALPDHHSHSTAPEHASSSAVATKQHPSIRGCRCHLWKYGIHWLMEEGVECIVEVARNCTEVIVVARSQDCHSLECTRVFSSIIENVFETLNEFSSGVSSTTYIIDPVELKDRSLLTVDTCHMYSKVDIFRVLLNRKPTVVSTDGVKHATADTLSWVMNCSAFGEESTQSHDQVIPANPLLDQTPDATDFTYLESPDGDYVCIIQEVQAHWPELAAFFQLPSKFPDNIRASPNWEPGTACEQVFKKWLKGGQVEYRQPKTWATVILAIERVVQDQPLADKVRALLSAHRI